MVDRGPIRVRMYWDQSASTYPPLETDPETITITYPLKSGESTAATLAGTGFLTREKGPDLQNGEVVRARRRLLVLCLVDDDGKPLLSESDVDTLANLDGGIAGRLDAPQGHNISAQGRA